MNLRGFLVLGLSSDRRQTVIIIESISLPFHELEKKKSLFFLIKT